MVTLRQWLSNHLKGCQLVALWALGLTVMLLLHHSPHGLASQPPALLAQSPPPQQLFEQGQRLYDTGQFRAAQSLWEAVIQDLAASGETQSLNQAAALSNLSLTAQALGEWESAQDAIEQALNQLGFGDAAATPVRPATHNRDYVRVLAQTLDIRGQLYYLTGQPDQALMDWQQTQGLYQRIAHIQGTVGSLLNQVQAYQALGQYLQAEATLDLAQASLPADNPALQRTLWQTLAQTEQLLGNLDSAIEHLAQAERLTSEDEPGLRAQLALDKGNTYQALAIRRRDLGKPEGRIQEAIIAALRAYAQAAENASLTPGAMTKLTRLQASVNQLQLRTRFAEFATSQGGGAHPTSAGRPVDPWEAIAPPLVPIEQLKNTIDTLLRDPELPIGRSTLFAKISFAEQLLALAPDPDALTASAKPIAELLGETIYQAHTLQDLRAEASAMGRLAGLYGLTQQPQTAQDLTQQAILLSTQAQAPDIRYQWYRQLGQLFAAQGDEDRSLNAYRAAVTDLQTVRHDLLIVDSEVQFSFRDTVEPIYRELIQLLLETSKVAPDGQLRLKEALTDFDELQLAEINNFLGCTSGEIIPLAAVEAPNAAILYAINLPNSLAVILDLPAKDNTLMLKEIPYEALLAGTSEDTLADAFSKEIAMTRRLLESPSAYYEALEKLQALYQWFLAPLDTELSTVENLDTLVFVLDGELRNIPIAALHDGEHFLTETYKVALSPRIKLFEPKKISRALKAFIGGIGEVQGNIEGKGPFELIAELETEFQAVQAHVASAHLLEGQAFTESNMQAQLADADFSVIHLKSHGIFSSDPDETFIVGFKELIKGRELGNLIKAEDTEDESTVDLLVLSACETAKGDNRAVLGMTGIAVRAGARSVVSSLWKSQDRINTVFMDLFYQYLAEGQARAEAFQAAQTYLIAQDFDISDWATYVLVGNWQ